MVDKLNDGSLSTISLRHTLAECRAQP